MKCNKGLRPGRCAMLPVRAFPGVFEDVLRNRLNAWSRLPRLFDEVFEPSWGTTDGNLVPVDIHQDADKLVIEAEMPGMKKEDLSITMENNVLTLAGKRTSESEKEGTNYHVRERRTGEFSRSFRLPDTADGEKITADLTNGVLTLMVPTREEAKPRRIEVKS
jgi:HSP20 family protein